MQEVCGKYIINEEQGGFSYINMNSKLQNKVFVSYETLTKIIRYSNLNQISFNGYDIDICRYIYQKYYYLILSKTNSYTSVFPLNNKSKVYRNIFRYF